MSNIQKSFKTGSRGKVITVFSTVAAALFISHATVAAAGTKAPKPDAAAAAEDVQTALQMARAARAAGDPAAAAPLYRKALTLRADPAVQAELGDVLLQAGLIDDAIGAYEAVEAGSPARVDALLGLQRAYARLDQPQKALAYAQQAADLGPRDERAQIGLGVALDAAGRHAEAQAAYRRALAVAPRSVAARNDLALSLALTGGYDEAVDLLTPIARSANATPQVRQNLAMVYGLKGDREQALALGRADLDPAQAEANLRLFELARGR